MVGGQSVTRPALYQDWHHLLFLHWKVPAETLRQLLPPGLTLDLFQGSAYVGLIPFTITGSRPWFGPAIPFLSDFHEVNVRTYVRHEGDPGVMFFSLDAASCAAVLAARATYLLPYHFARIRVDVDENGPTIEYRSERRWPEPLPANCSIRYRILEGDSSSADPGTIEHFLVERYSLYTSSKGKLYRAGVEHEPYPLKRVDVEKVQETLVWAAGIRRPDDAPLAHYSPGVSVRIYALERV